MDVNSPLKLLSAEEVGIVYEKCLDILSGKGVKITHPEGVRILDKAGAQVNFIDQQVRFPKDLIEKTLSTVPRGLTLAGRDECYDISIPHPRDSFYVCTFAGNPSYVDPNSNTQRDATLNDVEELGQLVQALDEIDICSYPFPADAPSETADIHALKALFENTSKPILVHPYSFESLEYLFELAQVVAGRTETLEERPIISLICCSQSPLQFKEIDIEAIILGCRYGVPLDASSLPSAGATGPITISGNALLMGVEILAMVVMSQLIKPGAPIYCDVMPFTLDMSTGEVLQSSVEGMLCGAAGAQFIKDAFRIPTGTMGFGADSHVTDGQSVLESTLIGALTSFGRHSDILVEAGGVDCLHAYSPIQLIIDNTLSGLLKRISLGVKVDDDRLAWKEILDVASGDTFLDRPHTARHCRETLRPKLLNRSSTEEWISQGSKDLFARALDEYKALKAKPKLMELPDGVQKEMNSIIKRADEHLTK